MFACITQAQERFALVVGNNSYANAPLQNAVNDARDIHGELIGLGYQSTLIRDVTATELHDKVKAFLSEIEAAQGKEKLVLFYFAGHAIQISHTNYLVGVESPLGDAEKSRGLRAKSSIKQDSSLLGLFNINELLANLPVAKNTQNLVLLDACRNNPFGKNLLANEARSGLAPLKAPPGTLIAYSTEPGSVAMDGTGENGTYTKHLLQHLSEMISVEELFKKVRQGVISETANQQIPWEHSSLFSEAYINPPRNKDLPDLVTF